MRRFKPTEIGILILAVSAIVAGGDMAIFPKEIVLFHQVYRRFGVGIEHLSPNESRVYGVLRLLFGVLLLRLVFRGKRK